MNMNTPPKRIVTTQNSSGRSTVLFEDHGAEPKILHKAGGLVLTELWETQTCPVVNSGHEDCARKEQKIEPNQSGSLFRLIEYPPDAIRLASIDTIAHFDSMGVDTRHDVAKSHPGMHKTNTIDYAVIVRGEIYAVLDEKEVLMKQGDCIVQRGTHHAWSNKSNESCLIAFVLISAHAIS
jgi:mannose-6-phosphate isomerase-like protein (cupin superfamily)